MKTGGFLLQQRSPHWSGFRTSLTFKRSYQLMRVIQIMKLPADYQTADRPRRLQSLQGSVRPWKVTFDLLWGDAGKRVESSAPPVRMGCCWPWLRMSPGDGWNTLRLISVSPSFLQRKLCGLSVWTLSCVFMTVPPDMPLQHCVDVWGRCLWVGNVGWWFPFLRSCRVVALVSLPRKVYAGVLEGSVLVTEHWSSWRQHGSLCFVDLESCSWGYLVGVAQNIWSPGFIIFLDRISQCSRGAEGVCWAQVVIFAFWV